VSSTESQDGPREGNPKRSISRHGIVPQYLRADEEERIHRQFQEDTWRRNKQVLWSGIPRDEAQRWADKHEMQTLTTAMGPLMDLSYPLCLRNQKSSDAWSKVHKGSFGYLRMVHLRGKGLQYYHHRLQEGSTHLAKQITKQ
jgi:hypothetical protein